MPTNYDHFKHWACSLPCDERRARQWARDYVEKLERAGLAAQEANRKIDTPTRKRARDGMRALRERRRETEEL